MESEILNEKVLIAGGSGLIGSYLSQYLKQKGYQVAFLSRTLSKNDQFKTYLWDPEKGQIDNGAFKDLNYIIQLSGANIAEKRWTKKRKKKSLKAELNQPICYFK